MLLNRAILAPATCKNQLLLAQRLFDVGWSDEGKERRQIYTVKGREANKKNIKRTNIINKSMEEDIRSVLISEEHVTDFPHTVATLPLCFTVVISGVTNIDCHITHPHYDKRGTFE